MPKSSTRIKYTPAQISVMSDRTVKQQYQHLRTIANKRAGRLRAAGFGDTDVGDVSFPSSRGLSPQQLREQLAEASRYIRDPRTTVRGIRSYTKKMTESLAEAGYEIPARDLRKFGDFMETMRSRHKGRLMPSGIIASIYDQAGRVGISGATLLRNFKTYLDDEEKAARLLGALENASLPSGRRRLSSRELSALL